MAMETSEPQGNPLIILNPAANRGDMAHHRSVVRNRSAQEQADYRETVKQGDARAWAMQAAAEGRPIIVVGGDGTVNEVVNGMLSSGRRVPLGIVPAGSGNDFACYALKLPRDPVAALERAFNGRLVDVDAGTINGTYFVATFSIGLDADIAATTNWMRKIPLMHGGQLYYTSALWQLLFGYQHCPWLKLCLDGQYDQEVERRYVLMATTNGPTYGAGFRINPAADYSDGLLDICTIDYAPLLRSLKLLPVVKKGEHAGLPEVTFYRAKVIHIECKQTTNIQIDGEVIRAANLDAKVLPAALQVRV